MRFLAFLIYKLLLYHVYNRNYQCHIITWLSIFYKYNFFLLEMELMFNLFSSLRKINRKNNCRDLNSDDLNDWRVCLTTTTALFNKEICRHLLVKMNRQNVFQIIRNVQVTTDVQIFILISHIFLLLLTY